MGARIKLTTPWRMAGGKGDRDGQMTWMRVMRAVDELLSKDRPEGTEVH